MCLECDQNTVAKRVASLHPKERAEFERARAMAIAKWEKANPISVTVMTNPFKRKDYEARKAEAMLQWALGYFNLNNSSGVVGISQLATLATSHNASRPMTGASLAELEVRKEIAIASSPQAVRPSTTTLQNPVVVGTMVSESGEEEEFSDKPTLEMDNHMPKQMTQEEIDQLNPMSDGFNNPFGVVSTPQNRGINPDGMYSDNKASFPEDGMFDKPTDKEKNKKTLTYIVGAVVVLIAVAVLVKMFKKK